MKTTLGILVMFVLGTASAWAALGQYESSVGLDQQVLRGEIREEIRLGYKFHQITSPNGTIVREFVSPNGKVFGISWQAPFMPNLQQLLGSYSTEVLQAVQSRRRRHGGPLIVRTDTFVFVSGGHMRFFRGRAYIPGLLPNNVSAEVVQ